MDPFLPPESLSRALSAHLRQFRDAVGVNWAGVLGHSAPDGTLVPTWWACTDERAPPAPNEAQLRAFAQGDLQGLPIDANHRAVAVLTSAIPRLPVLLIFAGPSELQPEALALHQTLLEPVVANVQRAMRAELLLRAVEEAPDPFEITDRDARLVYANRAWETLFGHPRREVYGRTVGSVLRAKPESVHDDAFYDFTLAALKRGQPFVGALENQDSKDHTFFCEAHVAPFAHTAFLGNVAIRRELKHREERDRALAVHHRQFREVLSRLPDGAVVVRDGRIHFANPSFLDMVARPRHDVIGEVYASFVHAEDLELFYEHRHRVVEVRVVRPDGPARIAEIAAAGSVSFEGRPSTILMSRDVTESRISQETLARADRLAALGSLAAGLAHEINNPLAYVLLNLQVLRDTVSEQLPERARSLLAESIDGAQRIQRIVQELRTFSRADDGEELEPVDVTKAVTSALNIAQNEIRHRATLARRLEPGARVMAREGPLVQVLVSLLVNAAQAIPEHDHQDHRIRVRTGTDGDHIAIVVTDTGVGIAGADLSRVFEPYYTSKPGGSGLGLPIARKLIEDLGGSIRLRSRVGHGTTVTVRLPRAAPALPPHAESTAPQPQQGPRLSILVVDDEAPILRAIERVLNSHDLTTVTNPHDALQQLRDLKPLDLVVCDLMMPGVSGPELFRQATRERPELAERFLFMTGGVFSGPIAHFMDTWHLPVLEKPFDPSTLRERVLDIALGPAER